MTTTQKIKLLVRQAELKRTLAKRLHARGYAYFAQMYRREAQQHERQAQQLAKQLVKRKGVKR